MKSQELQTIGDTLFRIVTPDMTPKQLLNAAKREHPKASKKDIVRAAFYAAISHADSDPNRSGRLHAFTIDERSPDIDDTPGNSRSGW